VCRSQINVYPERDTRGQNGMRYGQFASTHTPSPQKPNERASKTLICIAFHMRSQHTFRPTATSSQYTSWASLHPLDRGVSGRLINKPMLVFNKTRRKNCRCAHEWGGYHECAGQSCSRWVLGCWADCRLVRCGRRPCAAR